MQETNNIQKVVGLRITGDCSPKDIIECPICGNTLQLSEFNFFFWCSRCNLDIPEILCLGKGNSKEEVLALTESFLSIIKKIRTPFSFLKFGENAHSSQFLALAIVNILDSFGKLGLREFRFILYKTYEDLKDQGIDIRLPHYWYVDGPHLYLRGLPAVFKLKLEREGKIIKIFVVPNKRITFLED
jgi:hypothetical protein